MSDFDSCQSNRTHTDGLHNWKASQVVWDLLWHLTSAYMKCVYGWVGERAGVRYVITKFSQMDSLPHFVTHGAPLWALRARKLRYQHFCTILVFWTDCTKKWKIFKHLPFTSESLKPHHMFVPIYTFQGTGNCLGVGFWFAISFYFDSLM